MTHPHLRGQDAESLAALWPDLRLDAAVARRIVSRLVFEDRDDVEGVRGLSKAAARGVLERGRTTRLAVVDRRRSAVPQNRPSAVPPNRRSAVPPKRWRAVPSKRWSAVLPGMLTAS